LLVEGQPSPEEFERLIEEYLEDYDPVESSDDEVTDDDDTDADESSIEKQGKNQVRIGFKVNGKNGATTWLDEYVLRHEIYTSLGNRNKHYSSSYLLGIVKSHRNDLITYLKEDNLKETEELSYTEADNDGEGNVTGLGA
ncbi:TPA: hypothetical protein ACHFPU_004684, partial [Enterobacter hormaechei]